MRPRGGSHGSPLLAPGDVLKNRYRVLGPVGNGGLAWVWEAEDLRSSFRVAVKQFKHGLDAPLRQLARREADLLQCVSHRGIPKLLGRGSTLGVPYLVLELVRGWNLQEAFDHHLGPLGTDGLNVGGPRNHLQMCRSEETEPNMGSDHTRAITARWPDPGRFALRLAGILAVLHDRGLVHRDINLQNVMTRSGLDGWEPVVVDLGLGCKRFGDRTRWGSRLAGNLRTLAPEQIERRAIGHDPRTDVYQLGLVLYRLLTGVDAFAGADLLVERILGGDFPCPREVDSRVDPGLEEVCLRTLARDPDRRPATAGQVRDALARTLASSAPSGSRGGGGAPAAGRAAGRRRVDRPGGWHAVVGT